MSYNTKIVSLPPAKRLARVSEEIGACVCNLIHEVHQQLAAISQNNLDHFEVVGKTALRRVVNCSKDKAV